MAWYQRLISKVWLKMLRRWKVMIIMGTQNKLVLEFRILDPKQHMKKEEKRKDLKIVRTPWANMGCSRLSDGGDKECGAAAKPDKFKK